MIDNIEPQELRTGPDGERPRSRMARIAQERAERIRRIMLAANNGMTIKEISEMEGVKLNSLARFLRASGVVLIKGDAGHAVLQVEVRRSLLPRVDRLAARWRCSRQKALCRIVADALVEHGRASR